MLALLDEAIALDERLRELTSARDGLRAEINELSRQVGALKRAGSEAEAEAASERSRQLGDTEKEMASKFDEVSEQLRQLMLVIPNIPHPEAPDGASDADNPLCEGPVVPDHFAEHQRVPHWDTATALGILDSERATKISGAMFTMQRGAGATLARALCQFALDRNSDAFEEIRPPS